MPANVPGDHAPAPPLRPGGPVISASRRHILVTGTGFLPDHPVTIRITNSDDGVVDYLTYSSDADGYLEAVLPETIVIDTGRITVTDHRPDPAGDGGLLWSNTVIVTATSP